MLNDARWRALNLYGRSFYQVRKGNEVSVWGFMATLPRKIYPENLYNAVITTPFRWQVLGIAYFSDGEKELERGWFDVVTRLPIAAQGAGLVPYLTKALDGAHAQGDSRYLYDSALVLRPYTRQRPSIKPVLRRHAKLLSLTEREIERFSQLK